MGPVGGRRFELGTRQRWCVVGEQVLVAVNALGSPGTRMVATGSVGEWLATACAQAEQASVRIPATRRGISKRDGSKYSRRWWLQTNCTAIRGRGCRQRLLGASVDGPDDERAPLGVCGSGQVKVAGVETAQAGSSKTKRFAGMLVAKVDCRSWREVSSSAPTWACSHAQRSVE